MNLTGMEPELRNTLRSFCTDVMRSFDGAPEHAHTFKDAQDILSLLDEVEATPEPAIELRLGGRAPGLYVDGEKLS